jgi:hypothetical protein
VIAVIEAPFQAGAMPVGGWPGPVVRDARQLLERRLVGVAGRHCAWHGQPTMAFAAQSASTLVFLDISGRR